MKIAIFGCSWSHGVKNISNGYSWPLALSEHHPDWEIHNYALGGSSLSFQASLLDNVLAHDSYDKIVFQLTNPARFTYMDDDVNFGDYIINLSKNYRMFDMYGDIYRNIVCITAGALGLNKHDSFWKFPVDKYEFTKMYYSYVNRHINRTEYRALAQYVKSKSDIVFFHNEDVCDIGDIPVIMDQTGKKYVVDNGEHFNIDGSKWVADWVEKQL